MFCQLILKLDFINVKMKNVFSFFYVGNDLDYGLDYGHLMKYHEFKDKQQVGCL
jgi:hypothetical protein